MLRYLFLALGCAFGAYGVSVAEPAIAYGSSLAAGHTAQVNGIRLYYELYGDGEPLVMLHGNGGSIEALRFQIGFFRTHRRVIAIDSRGHGRSEMGPGRLTFEQMADDVAALLQQLHCERADLLGWSDGGIVALLVARRHPEVVRCLAISGANLSPEALKPDDLAEMKTEMQEAERKLAMGDASRPWAAICQYLQLDVTQPHLTAADLAAIHSPVLVMAGEHDMIPEAHTREIAALLPQSTLRIFAGAGHAALMEVPERFNAEVKTFFADAAPASSLTKRPKL
jgi:pimeloyl-ACP methyl ester carboxylesterase